MVTESVVAVVDDDGSERTAVRRVLSRAGARIEEFATGQSFLDCFHPGRAVCVLLELHLPDISGLLVQKRLSTYDLAPPVVVTTRKGDVGSAVEAMKFGAIDYLMKPIPEHILVDCVRRAIAQNARDREDFSRRREIAARFALLTIRERDVMHMVVRGFANKLIATHMHLSTKTIEAHRARVMRKMQADSLPELVRCAGMIDDGVPTVVAPAPDA